jgi:hypothetical protein
MGLWGRLGDSLREADLCVLRLRVALAAPVMAALLTGATPTPLEACSKATFIDVQPELYFVFTALPDTVEAGWSGATFGSRPLSDMEHLAPEGPLWAQVVRLDDVGGEAAKRLPVDSEYLIVVPWDYGADCRPLPWQRSARFLEPGEEGLMFATLRDPEHWVDGVPTADFHLPYSQPYPRQAQFVLRPLMSVEDAFRFHHVLPRPGDLRDDAAAAVAPLLEWARKNPKLARQGPANDMIQRHLRRITREEVRRLDVPVVGTYRFVLDLGDGVPRTFYARTRSAPTSPTPVEPGNDWVRELRPPSYGGYTLWAESAPHRELLGSADYSHPGGYLYLFSGVDPDDHAARRIPGAADLSLAARALPDDPEVQGLDAALRERGVFREYIDRNLKPGADAFFVLHPDGAVTFEQRYHLPDGGVVTLHGVRIQTDDGTGRPGT